MLRVCFSKRPSLHLYWEMRVESQLQLFRQLHNLLLPSFLSYPSHCPLTSLPPSRNILPPNISTFPITQTAIMLVMALISSLYFLIFTAGMLASTFRSVLLGLLTVQQLKKEKTASMTNAELRRLWLTQEGRAIISMTILMQKETLLRIGSGWLLKMLLF